MIYLMFTNQQKIAVKNCFPVASFWCKNILILVSIRKNLLLEAGIKHVKMGSIDAKLDS